MFPVTRPVLQRSGAAAMPEPQTFFAAATMTVNAMMHDIWAVWVDVNAWKSWDPGIDSTEMRGNFKTGTTFTLRPQGGEPVQVLIKTVTQGEEFSDETALPFGLIRNYHRMEAHGHRVRITHEVEAEVTAGMESMFAKTIWPHLQGGVSLALGNIVDIVGND
jgi:hypothetical protein